MKRWPVLRSDCPTIRTRPGWPRECSIAMPLPAHGSVHYHRNRDSRVAARRPALAARGWMPNSGMLNCGGCGNAVQRVRSAGRITCTQRRKRVFLRRTGFCRHCWLNDPSRLGPSRTAFRSRRREYPGLAAASGARRWSRSWRRRGPDSAAALRCKHRVTGQNEAVATYLETIGRRTPTGVKSLSRRQSSQGLQ